MNSPLPKLLSLILSLTLFGCSNHQESSKEPVKAHPDSVGSANDAQMLSADEKLVTQYRDTYQKDTVTVEKEYLSKLLAIIKSFNGKKLDTTVLTIGNIDGDAIKDTLYSRVYYKSDSIYVDSKWIKNNNILWENQYSDPYYSFQSGLINYDPTHIWEVFVLGILYGAPGFESRLEMEHDDTSAHNWVIIEGLADLKEAGIKIDTAGYKAYLRDFKGDPIAFGNPEGREGLWIWYQPARRFIVYYQP